AQRSRAAERQQRNHRRASHERLRRTTMIAPSMSKIHGAGRLPATEQHPPPVLAAPPSLTPASGAQGATCTCIASELGSGIDAALLPIGKIANSWLYEIGPSTSGA